jgi:hypothetical protein
MQTEMVALQRRGRRRLRFFDSTFSSRQLAPDATLANTPSGRSIVSQACGRRWHRSNEHTGAANSKRSNQRCGRSSSSRTPSRSPLVARPSTTRSCSFGGTMKPSTQYSRFAARSDFTRTPITERACDVAFLVSTSSERAPSFDHDQNRNAKDTFEQPSAHCRVWHNGYMTATWRPKTRGR